MTYAERVEIYKEIERLRGRPLIVYITSLRGNTNAQMAGDVIPQIIKQLICIPKNTTEVDILIVSNGGDPMVSWRIISLLRERFNKIGVLIPYTAYSAATLLALGADEIVMHPFSNLGPVDPQLTVQKDGDSTGNFLFGAEDLRHFMDFVRKDVGISDQEQLERAFELVCKDVGSIPIGVAKRSSYLALTMGEQLLSLHMSDSNKAKAIAEALNRSFYHHGYALGRTEAEQIGLRVVRPDDSLEEVLWQAWENIEAEMECNKPFNPLGVVLENDQASLLLAPVQQLQLPANLPADILQQVYNQVLQQIGAIQISPTDYTLFLAAVESVRCSSAFNVEGKIFAVRKPDMTVSLSIISGSQSWSFNEAKQGQHKEAV